MLTTEKKLRSVIRKILIENSSYDPWDDRDRVMPGSYGSEEESYPDLSRLEKMFDDHEHKVMRGEQEKMHGYSELKKAKMACERNPSDSECKERYLMLLRGYLGDVIDMYGMSSFIEEI